MKKENKTENVITKDMTIAKVLQLDNNLGEVFMGFGMFCIFCHVGEDETIEEAASVHDVDCEFLVKKLNDSYNKKKKKK